MKKIFVFPFLLSAVLFYSQFNISVELPATNKDKEAILYTLDGSKDIIKSKENISSNKLNIKFDKSYIGMMKLYFPNSNNTLNFISENKDVKIKVNSKDGKFTDIDYLDPSNIAMNDFLDLVQKKDVILPALLQIKDYYKTQSKFGKDLDTEISRLSKSEPENINFPFVNYYQKNYDKFLSEKENGKANTQEDIVKFINNTGSMLENSALLRPILLNYLNIGGNQNADSSVETMLKAVNVETQRGQTILSEFIDIFEGYGMLDMKKKYLDQAKSLKCTIFDRLNATLKSNANVELGAKIPDYVFKMVKNSTAKSLYGVKADYKVILVWASTCSHCEKELPKIAQYYNQLQNKNIQIIGLSIDTDRDKYTTVVNALPWINDSELQGWKSTFVESYNIVATPTYFILDKDNKIVNKPDHFQDVLTYFNMK